MKAITTKSTLAFVILVLMIFSSCRKKENNLSGGNSEAIMNMDVICTGDIQSQVAVLTFAATNSNSDLISIVNDTTGIVFAGPFLQNSDFSTHKIISFHSAAKVSSVSVMLAISPKVYTTSPDQNFSMTIKIYFEGKLKDNQTFSYDQLFDSTVTTPKDFDYKVAVNQ